MGSRPLRHLLAAVAVVLLGTAMAQYAGAPYFTQPLVQSQALGFEMALQRLTALEFASADEDDLDDDWEEVIEGLEHDLGRFMGSLQAADAELAETVDEAVEELEETFEAGGDLAGVIAEARQALERAYTAVVPAAVRGDPMFVAALIADMSLSPIGVGEGYEEAIEGELPAFTLGYVALARVRELWSELAGDAGEQQRADVEEMLAFIATLYPTPLIDEPIVGNPEEAEAPVQRIIGILETVVDAELYAGRDLAALATRLPEQLAGACGYYDAGDDALGLEIAISVGYRYLNADLGEFMGFMAPDTHEEITELIAALTGVSGEDDDDDEGETADADDDDDEAVAPGDPAAQCRALLEELEEAADVFGG